MQAVGNALALDGKATMEFASERLDRITFWDDVHALCDPTKERIQERNYPLPANSTLERMSTTSHIYSSENVRNL